MHLDELRSTLGIGDPGVALHGAAARLYPICRSITGDGVRETLTILKESIPLEVHEVPSGTPVLDWTVPREWNIRDAYVKNARGERVVDFRRSNLHVVGYSTPVNTTLTLAELKPRLHSLPNHPDWIPYRNSFYRDDWGFCLSHRALTALADERYEVVIDSTLADGNLTYGEFVVPGISSDEVLLSAHVCHPSLANDNLSGLTIATLIARYLHTLAERGERPRYTYRFLFAPATIGAITWLARNEERASRIKHGLVLTLLGDPGRMTYKRSQRSNALVDRAAAHVLGQSGAPHEIREFIPYGYDERQFCSPGFDLAVGCLMRTPYTEFPEYHSSGDNLDFVRPAALAESLAHCLAILDVLEKDRAYLNLKPKAEPQLGRRGIYRALSERIEQRGSDRGSRELSMLWMLNQSNGNRTLLDIAERSGLSFTQLYEAACLLREHELLRAVA